MKSTDSTNLIETVIASGAASGYVTTIPTDQATAGDGTISLTLGSPPECAISVSAGGKRPLMKDVNGVYKLLSAAIQSVQSWGILPYSSDFATAIGGYPEGAVCSDGDGVLWYSTADDNTTVPGATDATWTSILNGAATETWVEDQDYATESYVEKGIVAGLGLAKYNSNPGYSTLPGGMIIQYGRNNSGDGGNSSVTFPIEFPNACVSITLTEQEAGGTWPGTSGSGRPTVHGVNGGASTSSFASYSMEWNGSDWTGVTGLTYGWMAIGF